jgi:hypothetical protein
MWESKWESWRTYLCFALVGAIFIISQVLSGGGSGSQAEGNSADPGDRSYRDALRIETAGRGGRIFAGNSDPQPRRRAAAESGEQTD